MAEEGSVYELEGLEKQLQSLLSRYSSEGLRADSKPFCLDYCKLVEEYASRWQVPLPQLRILEVALCCFARASTFFSSNCDHVLHTLSSLALSVFELLLFFDQKDFHQEPLKHFTVTFQECHSALAKHQNVHLLQVERLVRGGGAWASTALQAILSDSSLPQNEVDECISSELAVFFELRVRYLLSCERLSEALALAKCCARHPTAGQHLFFLQVYLTWLHKTSQHDRLHKEVADFSGKDAVHIICNLEREEKDELLLALSRAFLSQQLRRGNMYYLCDLVFVWSKLHSRLKSSKQSLLEETRQLMLSATNVNSIFPFIRVILQELGDDGIQFCVELCANALESCLSCDVVTKSLIYKTIAGLLPNDLEVCRACALLVFFLERSVDTYKMVYLLYMQPDQDYNVEHSPMRNHIRFETLQVLKKGLPFDPEFWNLIALRTNCLKLMSGKVVDAALEEIMDEKWISKYCTKEAASRSRTSCHKGSKGAAAKKRHHKEDRHPKEDITDMESKRLKLAHGKTRLNVDHALKKKGNQGSRHMKEASSEPLRRSFWQLDRIQDNVVVAYGEQRRTTRLSEKNPPKRRIRKPKWLLEDSGTHEENSVPSKFKKHGLKHGKHHRSSVVKGSESGQIKNNSKHKVAVNSHLKAKENNTKLQKGLDSHESACTPQVILELSLPDNELMGTFADDACNKQRGFPQMLLYKPTVKLPATSQPVKAVHRKEVILRARDATMFVQQLHCYTRRQKGKRNGSNIHGSVSTITRSSVQGSPPKDPTRELCESPDVEMKGGIASQTPEASESSVLEKVLQKKTSARELFEKSAVEMKVATPSQTSDAQKVTETSILEKVPQAQTTEKVSQTISSARELCEESAVEMKVTIASQTPAAAKATQSSVIDKVSKAHNIKDVSKTTASAEVSQTSTAHNNRMVVTDEIPPNSSTAIVSNTGAPGEQAQSSLSTWCKGATNDVAHVKANTPEVVHKDSDGHSKDELKRDRADTSVQKGTIYGENIGTLCESTCVSTEPDSLHDISALTLVTEMVTEFPPGELARDLENHKQPGPEDGAPKESTSVLKPNVPHKIRTTSSCSLPQQGASAIADMQGKKEYEGSDDSDAETVESEESKLEYNCIFCNKDFKGHRVVVHAMFHYRKDECMFCGTMFKDDLLAMMHLSDHIEKLKKIKAQENCVSETKDISTPKTSSKAKNTNVSSGLRSSGRQRKCTVRPNSLSNLESSPSESRKLRSRDKPADGQDLQEKEKNKHHDSKTPVHKVNGHVGKKKQLDRMKQSNTNSKNKQPLKQREIKQEGTSDGGLNPGLVENHDLNVDSSTTSVQVKEEFGCSTEDTVKETESLQVLKTATKQNGQVVEEKNVDPQEKVCCPADGCTWFTDQSKNRVALLYHALDDHYGDVKPLQLSFQISNSRCSICMRVLWSFEHFQHHVERHKLAPRHPCLHQDCTVRFKTGMEMRRHARRHSPLQAVCCLPGCSQLFICLWALNLHEREHYASKSTKPIKNTNVQTNEKHNNSLAEQKHDHKPKDSTAATTVKKTLSVKTARKLRGQAAHNSSTGKNVSAPPLSNVKSSLLKQETNETKDSNVLKNLSNKDTTAESDVPNLRLRQPLRKRQVAKTNLLAPKTHKVLSLLKHKSKMRHKFKKQQVKVNTKDPKRRGRPPKSNKAVHDENTTTDCNNEAIKKKTQPPASPSETAETSTVGNKLKVEEEKSQHVQDEVKITETSTDESKSKKSVNKHVKQNVLHNKSAPAVTAKSLNQSVTSTSAEKKQKLTADKGKKSHITKKRCAPDDSHTASLDSIKSKKQKVTNSNKTAKTVNKKCSKKELGVSTASKNLAKSKSETKAAGAVESLADEERKAEAENPNSTQNIPGNSFNEITSPHTTSGEKKQKLSTKENKSHAPKENNTQTASSDSGKAKKKHTVIIKKGDKKTAKERRPCKDQNKTSASKKTAKSKSVVQQAEAKAAAGESCPNVEGEAKEETSDATLDSPGSSCVSAVTANIENETTPPQTSPEENKQKETTKKSQDVKKSEHKKAKVLKKEGDTKKKCPRKDESTPPAPKKTKPKTQPKVKTEERAESEDDKSTVCIDTLAEYGKKPYMRLPPTAYLDEKFITMPKRRKGMLSFQSSQKCPPPEQANVTAAQQRQRCANCFATFNSAEELQSHLQLQSCSNLFGFDSDDEGNS
ncbi:uncharacterized protein LOC133976405 [Scomber scombrus]|uniref:uncharacterized protein LOC133976405 n=1 Tax=Scomber scombrus TaxID=13677 RepID=UPI002DDC71A1|nr:uncharacterized protein LOC133976405 [Scomber scombrus]